jgi:hypothetical protein
MRLYVLVGLADWVKTRYRKVSKENIYDDNLL